MRYYISSRPVDAAALLDLVCGHWRVSSGRGNRLLTRMVGALNRLLATLFLLVREAVIGFLVGLWWMPFWP